MDENKDIYVEENNEIRVEKTELPEEYDSMDIAEDMLLAQIDAFRDRATRIQNMIREKQAMVAELEQQVKEKEAANIALQEELDRNKEEADELLTTVESQVDRLLRTVKNNMDNLEESIREQVSSNQEATEEQTRNLQETLTTVTDGLTNIQSDLSEKTHTESVQLYRMIQDLMEEHDKSEEASKLAKEQYQSLKKKNTVETVLLVISMLISIAALVMSLGII
ncbi:MAG: hypothetical protein HUJ71_09820 [Pseudobutyrivibrio sp.]|nr:hypothetical protein [Pseudobutyrivibrio sp.]